MTMLLGALLFSFSIPLLRKLISESILPTRIFAVLHFKKNHVTLPPFLAFDGTEKT